MLKIYKSVITLTFLAFTTNLFAQGTLNGSQKEGLMQLFKAELSQLKQTYNDNAQFTAAFNNYYNTIFTTDRQTYCALIMSNKLSAAQAKTYMAKLSMKYDSLHAQFAVLSTTQPNLLAQYSKKQAGKQVYSTCYPNDSNLNFATGNLTGWNGYSAVNEEEASIPDSLYGISGGPCGPVVKAGRDTNTNFFTHTVTYQVALMSTQVDSVMPSIPVVPTGYKYSARIGDSTNAFYGVGIITQSFMVTLANASFSYNYSLFLENPYIGHSYNERPYFQFALLNSLGDTIPGTKTIIASYDLQKQGYDSTYYAPESDYIYYTGWQHACVSLKPYIGQCITVSFMVADCSEGGHFGYGYFVPSTSSLGINTTPPFICGTTVPTLTAPNGALHYLWSGPAGGITGSDTAQNIQTNTLGTYQVILTGEADKCVSDTLSYTLTTHTAQASVSTTPYYCNAQEATAIGMPYGTPPFTYTWSSGQSNDTATALALGTYTFNATDATGCLSADTFSITKSSLLLRDSASKLAMEPGDSTLLAVKIIGYDSSATYSWAPANLVNSPNAASTYAHLTASTVYTVTATSPCGSITDTISVFKKCTSITKVKTQYNCIDTLVTATAITSYGIPPYTYLWSNGKTSQSDSGFSNLSTYYVIVTDSNACKDSVSFEVIQPNKITLELTSKKPACTGTCNGYIIATWHNGVAPWHFKWNTGDTISSITNICGGIYTATVIDGNGCSTSSIDTLAAPNYSITIVDSVKNGTCKAYGRGTIYPSGGIAPYTYKYVNSTTSFGNGSNLYSGTYNIVITDLGGCRDTTHFAITGNPLVVNISAKDGYSLCYGSIDTFKVVATGGHGGYIYHWSPSAGLNDTNTAIVAASPTVTTDYLITTSDTGGCSLTYAAYLMIGKPIAITVTGPDTVGIDSTITLTASAAGGAGYFTYTWQPGGSTGNTLTTTLLNSTVFTVTASDGCTKPNGIDSIKVFADSLTKKTICSKDPTTLKAPAGASTYAWSGPGIISSSNTQNIQINLPGTYTAVVTNVPNLPATKTLYYVVTTINPLAKVSTTPYYCNGPEGTAIAKAVGAPPFTYLWSDGKTTDTVSNLVAGTYTFKSTDGYGCKSVDTFAIPTYTIALRDSSSSWEVEPGDSVLLGVKAAGANSSTTYSWTPAASLSNPNSASTYAHPTKQTTYTVTVSSPCGTLTDSVTVATECTMTGTVTTKMYCEMICTATPVNGLAPYTYRWFDGGTARKDSGLIPGQFNQGDYVVITDANGCKDSVTFFTSVPGNLTIIPDTGVKVICPLTCNGNVNLFVYGGTSPYIFLWSNGETLESPTNLCVGTYTVQVTDANGCTKQITETLKEYEDSLKYTDSITSGTCITYGGACIYPSGGTPPYYYNIPGHAQNCFSSLLPGKNQEVIIDNIGCRDTARFVVPGGPMSATISPNDTTMCFGTTIKLISNVIGGDGTYHYQWSVNKKIVTADTTAVINISPLGTTTYSLKVTDTSGCTISVIPTQTVNIHSPIYVGIIASADTIAYEKSVTLTASVTGGTGNYSYIWQPAGSTARTITDTLNASQKFTVTVSDGCTVHNGVDSINIFVDTNFQAIYIDSLINGGCNNSIWVATNGAVSLSQFSFLWSNGATTDTISGLCAGSYSVTITDNKPIMPGKSTDLVLHILILNPSGINEVQNNGMFNLYPVPASGKLSISLSNNTFKPTYISVYDITGRQVAKQNTSFKHNTETLDVTSLANGTYMLMLSDGKTNSQAKFTVIH